MLLKKQGTKNMAKAKKVIVPTTKSGIMAALAEAGNISKKQAADIYAKLIELAYEGAKQNEKGWVIPGLGKLLIKKQAARQVRNPQTGEMIKKKACMVAKFRLAKAAKDALVPPKK
jgi:DNA-binding protein HU-beta